MDETKKEGRTTASESVTADSATAVAADFDRALGIGKRSPQISAIADILKTADGPTLMAMHGLLQGFAAGRLPGTEGPEAVQGETAAEPDPVTAAPVKAGGGEGESKGSARRPAKEAYDGHWTATLREALMPACGPLPLRPVTLGIVRCATTDIGKRLASALGGVHESDLGKHNLMTVVLRADILQSKKAWDTGAKLEAAVRREMLDGNAVVLCAQGELAPGIEALASWTATLDDLAPRVASLLRMMREEGHPLDMDDGTPFEEAWDVSRPVPYERLQAVHAWFKAMFEADGAAVTAGEMARLRDIAFRELPEGPGMADGGPRTFDEVPGLHPDAKARLGTHVARMRESAGQAPGLLLVGPPGSGKTMLAGLVARGTGRAFVEASATEWVATAHLGETLAAMRARFAEARRRAPSLMFIDELDTMGRRDDGDRNGQWTRMFVNGLLECLQGMGGRGDVAVIAATNDATAIDPAILRDGRIGEQVEIPLPTRAGRKEVLDFYLPASLRQRVDTLTLADRVGRCSPARIRALAEEAVLQGGADPGPEHLEEAFRVMGRRLAKGHELERLLPAVCAGLAGEALMAATAYGDAARIDGISARPGLADLGRVSVTHASGSQPAATAGDIRRALHVAVAPREARTVLAWGMSRGPGATPRALEVFSHLMSDETARANNLGASLARSGLADQGLVEGWASAEAAAAEVAEARRQVRRFLARCKPALSVLAGTLMREGALDGDLFARICGTGPGWRAPTLH